MRDNEPCRLDNKAMAAKPSSNSERLKMADSGKDTDPQPAAVRKIIVRIAAGVAAAAALFCAMVLVLPTVVSTGPFRDLAQRQLSRALHSSVAIRRLACSGLPPSATIKLPSRWEVCETWATAGSRSAPPNNPSLVSTCSVWVRRV